MGFFFEEVRECQENLRHPVDTQAVLSWLRDPIARNTKANETVTTIATSVTLKARIATTVVGRGFERCICTVILCVNNV